VHDGLEVDAHKLQHVADVSAAGRVAVVVQGLSGDTRSSASSLLLRRLDDPLVSTVA
jgi:hypothetical protein